MDPAAVQLAQWERLRNDARQTDQLMDQQLRRLEEVSSFDEGKLALDSTSSYTNGVSTSSQRSISPAPFGSTNHGSGDAHLTSSGGPGAVSIKHRSASLLEDVECNFKEAEKDFDATFARMSQLISEMEEICVALGPNSTAARHTERFRSVLAEKQTTKRRVVTEMFRRLERAELNCGRRNGGSELGRRRRGGGSSTEDDGVSVGVKILLEEQSSIQHTLNRVNGIVEQAHGTQDRLLAQRERFEMMGDKLVQIAERIPFVQNILHRINARRRREVVVLGSFMAMLTFVMVLL